MLMQQRLADSRWVFINSVLPYLHEQLLYASELRAELARYESRAFWRTSISLQVTFWWLIVLSYPFIFAPALRKTDRQLATTRRMLLFFPDEVLRNVPTIKKMTHDVVKAV